MSPMPAIARVLALSVVMTVGPAAAAFAKAPPRQAVLTVTGDMTCHYPTGAVDHQVSTESIPLVLPETDGPVSGLGKYRNQGTGYTLAGAAAAAGEVRGDAELVLTYRQWNYNGEWMYSDAPAVPTKAQPVVIPLEPGSEKAVRFHNAFGCSGEIVYRIDFTRETQVWQIDLAGERKLLHRTIYSLIDPYTQKFRDFDFEHGFTFTYGLGARVTLEKRTGVWQVISGQVIRASVKPTYHQDPALYTIHGQKCTGCKNIAALAGKSLSATLKEQSLILHWPYHAPVVSVSSTFAMQCAPGPHKSSCEQKKKDGSNYADEDSDFFTEARLHKLPLQERQMAPIVKKQDVAANLKLVRYEYYVTRVK